MGKEWYVLGIVCICLFVGEDGGKDWNRVGEKFVVLERIKSYLIFEYEIFF